ncbi:MAG: hypothetical protein NBKEAIPA_00085 [Nitrospirae bacterium]|nr:MAG: hypothetical protein UZ03_NOB001000960 [Nitrospira sp. OLB3]MBV6468221.1 hypothetical protein [Nitrospirota bacterium]MCE7966862.1 hypothetical protein [Nitrospira sp. NTP2]MCK6493756.1 hypothetical protein [Nitrospira sp.]MEB2337451.1 hypothetical protein [Nitrospirales bacterium]
MLKIMLVQEPEGTRVILAGRLVGPWVEELRRCWNEAAAGYRDRWRVDLRETTHVDEAGKALLSELFQRGVTFTASGCLTRAIVEGLAVASPASARGLITAGERRSKGPRR